jgi:hypothetical protein
MISKRFGPTWYGQKGTLTSVGDKIECHICGKVFHNLATHVLRTHEISPDDYRDEFGLMAKTALISAVMAHKKAVSANFLNPDILKRALQKNTYIHSRTKGRSKRSLQETLENADRTARFIEAGRVATQRRIADGTFVPPPPSPEASRRNIRAAIAKRAELLRNPLDRENLINKYRAARIIWRETTCVWCRQTFQQPSGKQRRTCSDACRKARQRQLHAEMMSRADVLDKLSTAAKQRASLRTRDEHGAWVQDGK